MSYKIFESASFDKIFRKAASPYEYQLIKNKLLKQVYVQLKGEPHYGRNIKKLKDYTPETWRYRIGSFRIFYAIDETKKTIIITSIRLRKDAY